MMFLEQLSQFGTLREKTRKTYRRTDARAAFVEQAKKQIQAIQRSASDGSAKGHWFKREANGSYVVQLKNGATTLKLEGERSEIQCPDATSAIAVLTLASTAAQSGELDALLEATKRAPRKRASKLGEGS